VLDLWVAAWRKRHAVGEVIIVRYADDFVLGFQEEIDAKCCLGALKERFAKFHLELHPEKTRLLEFGRFAAERRSKRGEGPPETFDFLGFTHISGKTSKGDFTIRRISALKKLKGKLIELKDKLKRMVHWDLAEVGSWLSSVYKGWCNYHAIPLNSTRLFQFRTAIQQIWLCVLRRRSQRARRMTW
ncbi:reverse transcriptase domain-containing protein, partial [Schlesneria paludicola]|uniref:reverse transcriptase domain-containing protein n=1 Tax=Schlesneria paludicola TaxID=360056 RepID=UPI00029A29C5